MTVRSNDYEDTTCQPLQAPSRRNHDGEQSSLPPPTRKAFSMTEFLVRGASRTNIFGGGTNCDDEEHMEKDDSVVFEPDSTHTTSKSIVSNGDDDDDCGDDDASSNAPPGTPSTASMEDLISNSPKLHY